MTRRHPRGYRARRLGYAIGYSLGRLFGGRPPGGGRLGGGRLGGGRLGGGRLGRWRDGHGPSRAVAVFGLEEELPQAIGRLMEQCPSLRAAAGTDAPRLDGSPESLDLVDRILADAPDPGGRLRTDAANYLGTVLVRSMPGATWRIWPNGHPVVVIGPDEVDLIAELADRPADPELTRTVYRRLSAD